MNSKMINNGIMSFAPKIQRMTWQKILLYCDQLKKMSAAFKFSSRLRELRIHLCHKNTASNGVRDFINDHYLTLKQTNPKCPILIRECEGIQPKLWARFDNGREDVMSLSNKNSNDILKQLEAMVKDSLVKKN